MDWKAQASGIITLAAVISLAFGAVNYFQTDAEAKDYQQKHQSELINFRVQQIDQQIADYRYRLLSTKLNPEQREWIYAELKRLEETKNCIREGKC